MSLSYRPVGLVSSRPPDRLVCSQSRGAGEEKLPMPRLTIDGVTGLVTGANRGIGRALVEALLSRGAARVYAAARRPDALADLVAASGGRVVPLRLDITIPAEARAAAAIATDVQLLI